MSENKNAYPVYFDASIKDDNIIISGIHDFECGDPLFLINIDKTTTGKVSEIVDNRHPGFYIGYQLASQLAMDLDPWGDVIHVMKLITPDMTKENFIMPNKRSVMMNKSYNIYFDPEIEGDDIIVCGIDDFKRGDRLILVNTFHMTSGEVKSQIPETPDKPSGLYVGIRLSMDLGIDAGNGGDVINVLKADHPSPSTLNIEFKSNDSDIHKVILEQMNISLEKSAALKKMNIAIYNHSFASENVAGIGINLDALEEDPWAISEKIGRVVQAFVAKYLLDLKDLKKLKNRGMEDNKTNENNKPYPVYPVYYDESIKDDNIVISIKDDNIIIPGIKDFNCGNQLFLINIENTVTGVVSEITINRDPGFYIGDHLASQLAIDIDPGGDVIRVMKIPMISNRNDG